MQEADTLQQYIDDARSSGDDAAAQFFMQVQVQAQSPTPPVAVASDLAAVRPRPSGALLVTDHG